MARAGIFTASELDNLITPEWKPRTGQTPDTYIYRKVAEHLCCFPLDTGSSWAMEQGVILETEALPWFEFSQGVTVRRVGFITNDDGTFGCSPDGLIDGDEDSDDFGGIEIKCPQPATHVRYLDNGELPKEYAAQVHGSMYVTGRSWWKFLSYSRQLPPLLLTIHRDERIIAAIRAALSSAQQTYNSRLSKLQSLKSAHEAPLKAAYEAKIREWELTGKIP